VVGAEGNPQQVRTLIVCQLEDTVHGYARWPAAGDTLGWLRKGNLMPNPKRRHSKTRTSSRRAHDALKAHTLSECPNCHERKLPHRACPKCGYYKGREVLEVEEAS
jgi:large subunit ribosomal protein L32